MDQIITNRQRAQRKRRTQEKENSMSTGIENTDIYLSNQQKAQRKRRQVEKEKATYTKNCFSHMNQVTNFEDISINNPNILQARENRRRRMEYIRHKSGKKRLPIQKNQTSIQGNSIPSQTMNPFHYVQQPFYKEQMNSFPADNTGDYMNIDEEIDEIYSDNSSSDDDSQESTNEEETCEIHSVQQNEDSEDEDRITRKYSEYWNFGKPSKVCPHCNAIVWYEEKNRKKKRLKNPKFSICCKEGKVQLPLLTDPPQYLMELLDYNGGQLSKKFRENIRKYNSMFQFTSMGGKIDRTINNGRGPYVFRLNGQNHHKIGTLLPDNGSRPKFAQLYIHDTQNEVENRLDAINKYESNSNLEREIVTGLIRMLDENNSLTKTFRMARDRFQDPDILHVRIRLFGNHNRDERQYNLPTASEVAAIIVDDSHGTNNHRDIIVEETGGQLKRVHELQPSYMAMQYPILFPYAEDGFKKNILYSNVRANTVTKRNTVSMREFYAFRIQQRNNEGQTLIRGGRLFQQYLVDAYACIEEDRLSYVRSNQKKIRAELYQNLADAVVAGDTRPTSVGKRLVLPSSFTGGPRYMVQNYQDAIAICRWTGSPDIFITFTCNPKWPEITEFLNIIPGQKPEDRPDIVSRVFKIKLDELMVDLCDKNYFCKVMAAVYTIEFQKRGLPHSHILLFLHGQNKPKSAKDINRIISAELPDKEKDLHVFESVVEYMIHGPCGDYNNRSPCIEEGKWSKKYPKKFTKDTTVDKSGFPVYRRRDNQRVALKNGIEIDNRWVVPHNVDNR